MPVYDVNGNQLNTVYGVNGTALGQAYDVNGNPVFRNGSITVMSFNIQRWGGINANTSLMNSIFSSYKPLVCGVQETGTNGTLNYIGTQFTSGIAMSNEVPNKTGFLFNTTYTNYSDHLYATQGAGEKRGYQKCYIEVDGKSIALFNTHLDAYQSNIKVAQAMELLEEMQEEIYFIAMGDWNLSVTSFSDTEYTNLAKPFIDAGFNLSNWTTETGLVNTWYEGSTTDGDKEPTDNIITSSNITIDNVIIDTAKLAVASQTGQDIDHLPMISYLTVT